MALLPTSTRRMATMLLQLLLQAKSQLQRMHPSLIRLSRQLAMFGSDACLVSLCRDVIPVFFPQKLYESLLNNVSIYPA
jgi:hypothetical protein